MTASSFFDKTSAVRERPATGTGINADGSFSDTAPSTLAVKVHVARPKEDIALPGGIILEVGDVVVACDKALDIKQGDFLVFWDRRYEILAEIHRYDVLQAATNHGRHTFLVRQQTKAG